MIIFSNTAVVIFLLLLLLLRGCITELFLRGDSEWYMILLSADRRFHHLGVAFVTVAAAGTVYFLFNFANNTASTAR